MPEKKTVTRRPMHYVLYQYEHDMKPKTLDVWIGSIPANQPIRIEGLGKLPGWPVTGHSPHHNSTGITSACVPGGEWRVKTWNPGNLSSRRPTVSGFQISGFRGQDSLKLWAPTRRTRRRGGARKALNRNGRRRVVECDEWFEKFPPGGARHPTLGRDRARRNSRTDPTHPTTRRLASSRPRLTATPLPFSLPSALRKPGHRTFTYEVTRHARRTRSASGARPFGRVTCKPFFGGTSAAVAPHGGTSANRSHRPRIAHFFELPGIHVVDESANCHRIGAACRYPWVV